MISAIYHSPSVIWPHITSGSWYIAYLLPEAEAIPANIDPGLYIDGIAEAEGNNRIIPLDDLIIGKITSLFC